MHVLVVDGNHNSALLLKRFLQTDGHRVSLREEGADALAYTTVQSVNLVFIGVGLPDMCSYALAEAIRQRVNGFLYVIFVTDDRDEKALAHCLERGGDDFLLKPYNRVVVKAKIAVVQRMLLQYEQIQAQRDVLNAHNARLQQELELAEKVFVNIARHALVEAANIQYRLHPASISSGDVIMMLETEERVQYLLLADFTGHGLAAALGALPVSRIFRQGVQESVSIVEMVMRLNGEMRDILPTGMFMAAAVMRYNRQACRVELFNAAMPDIGFFSIANREVGRAVSSNNLPLGILGNDSYVAEVEAFAVAGGDRLFFCSDGVVEARNRAGEMFDLPRVFAMLQAGEGVDEVWAGLEAFCGGQPQHDDITLAEVHLCG